MNKTIIKLSFLFLKIFEFKFCPGIYAHLVKSEFLISIPKTESESDKNRSRVIRYFPKNFKTFC